MGFVVGAGERDATDAVWYSELSTSDQYLSSDKHDRYPKRYRVSWRGYRERRGERKYHQHKPKSLLFGLGDQIVDCCFFAKHIGELGEEFHRDGMMRRE